MVKLDESKITSQGQISIPKKVRLKLQLKPGDKVVFWEDEKGRIILRESDFPLEFTPEDWDKFLAKTETERVTRVSGTAAALRHLSRLKAASKHKPVSDKK